MVQTWFVCHETWHITLFGVYYFVEKVIIENNCHMLDITCKVTFLMVFFIVFGTFSFKVFQTWFVCQEKMAQITTWYRLFCLNGYNRKQWPYD